MQLIIDNKTRLQNEIETIKAEIEILKKLINDNQTSYNKSHDQRYNNIVQTKNRELLDKKKILRRLQSELNSLTPLSTTQVSTTP